MYKHKVILYCCNLPQLVICGLFVFYNKLGSTLFSTRSAHWFHPVIPVTPGHWPQPHIMSSLSNGLGTPFKNSLQFSCRTVLVLTQGLLRVTLKTINFDKIKMTRGRGWWPRDLRKLGWFSCMCKTFGEECRCPFVGNFVCSLLLQETCPFAQGILITFLTILHIFSCCKKIAIKWPILLNFMSKFSDCGSFFLTFVSSQ